MPYRLLLPILAATVLLLAGCLPESKTPLSRPSASRIDSRLEGAYLQRDNDDKKSVAGYWHFHYRGVRTDNGPRSTPWLEVLTVEPSNDGGLKTERYEALATRLGGHDYFSFVSLSEGGGKKGKTPSYSFARYEVNWRGDVRVWIADNTAFAKAIKAGKLRGKVVHHRFGDDVELTDTTERLAAFIAATDPKELFSAEPMVMRRIAR